MNSSDGGAERDEVDQLDRALKMLAERLEAPQTYSFSNITHEHLEKFNVVESGVLKLKEGHEDRATATDSIQRDEGWSADQLHQHLSMLETLIPRTMSGVLNVQSLKLFSKKINNNYRPERSRSSPVD